jgi:hypothetical protein
MGRVTVDQFLYLAEHSAALLHQRLELTASLDR